MKIKDKHYRTIWQHPDRPGIIRIIDQRKLPFEFVIEDLHTFHDALIAITDMHVRGAGLIGATAGFAMYLAAFHTPESSFQSEIRKSADILKASRPTAVNLQWAVDRQLACLNDNGTPTAYKAASLALAIQIADEDALMCRQIGEHGATLIEELSLKKRGEVVNILTHCNAGWLAFVDYGSALSPVYLAYDMGLKVHVWVDETRPRNQGARLTAWELHSHGVPFTVIPDNAGGHLMQHGLVDMVITGADRVTRSGDAANKIGTYLKALAAADNNIPFYVALPSSTFDWTIDNGVTAIPIEQRSGAEVNKIDGLSADGKLTEIQMIPAEFPVANYGFDVTPARMITGLITERGICGADSESIRALYPEKYS